MSHQCIPSVTLHIKLGIYVMQVALKNRAWHSEKKACTFASFGAREGTLTLVYSDHTEIALGDVI